VWFVGGKSRNIEPEVAATLAVHGFHLADTKTVGTVIVSEYTR
jgi:mannosyltransferase